MNLVQRIVAAVSLSLAAAGFTVNETGLPVPVERAAIMAALLVMTPEMEGTVYEAYPDTGGVWTICTGHTLGVRRGAVASPEQCEAYLRADLGEAVDFVMREVPNAPLFSKIALADFAYNLGLRALARSTLLQYAKAGLHELAAQQFGRWMFVAGRDCREPKNNCGGIPRRRELQRQVYMVRL
ncbi:glycoside hydrolase family protein [Pseudomonas sp. PE-S1G-1]|uniref:glycoside hydrolase family protein n=1 Tax=Pseudomonas sp. PE-S1G-1 TaxID=1986995 RepID=UPI000B3FB159|nr:glycoside hydrolase family protein [Pseudomonas sp. PE-S1G-1]